MESIGSLYDTNGEGEIHEIKYNHFYRKGFEILVQKKHVNRVISSGKDLKLSWNKKHT